MVTVIAHIRALAVVAVAAALLLAGCTAFGMDQGPQNGSGLVDPLAELTDTHSDRFVGRDVHPVIHERGQGSRLYSSLKLPSQTAALTVYVACAPAGPFTVRVGTQWYSGHCAARFQNSGGFPVGADDRPKVKLEVGSKTATWIVAVPEEPSGGG